MTVQELIDKLQKEDKEKEVFIWDMGKGGAVAVEEVVTGRQTVLIQ